MLHTPPIYPGVVNDEGPGDEHVGFVYFCHLSRHPLGLKRFSNRSGHIDIDPPPERSIIMPWKRPSGGDDSNQVE